MKIRADIAPESLPSGLQSILDERRSARNFHAADYLTHKTALVNDYFEAYGLDTAIVAVSGGIDSAVVLGIMNAAENVKTVVPVLLPAAGHAGVTGQDAATSRGKEVCQTFDLTPVVLDVAEAVNVIDNTVFKGLQPGFSPERSNWGTGQLVPYTRTPFLYYVATMLTDNGHRALIAGTTNYSEGAYLGYIGKASDAMVDLQIISDLYKSEVYDLARHLNVPESIINVAPTGDMFDDCTDEEVFGASYDFVELFLEYLNEQEASANTPLTWATTLTEEERDYFNRHAASLEDLHKANKHKYLAGSPAVHLDVRTFPLKTWKINTWKKGS